MGSKPIPTQEEADLNDPEEHFLWALRNLPTLTGVGMVGYSGYFRKWSKHLWECGFAHRDWLVKLADENGNIHVSRLPTQEIKFQEPFRGPHHTYNNAARWVGTDTPPPEPYNVPNLEEMTIQERYVLAYQLDQAGIRIPKPPAPPLAQEH